MIKKIFAFLIILYCAWIILGIVVGAFGKPVTISGIANRTKIVAENIYHGAKRTISNLF